jgi:hypothetical protein
MMPDGGGKMSLTQSNTTIFMNELITLLRRDRMGEFKLLSL